MQLDVHIVHIANRAMPTDSFRIALPGEIFQHMQQKFFDRVNAAKEVMPLILGAHLLSYAYSLPTPFVCH